MAASDLHAINKRINDAMKILDIYSLTLCKYEQSQFMNSINCIQSIPDDTSIYQVLAESNINLQCVALCSSVRDFFSFI